VAVAVAVAEGLGVAVAVGLGVGVEVRVWVAVALAVAVAVSLSLPAATDPPFPPSSVRSQTPSAANTIPRMPRPVHPMAWRAGVLKDDWSQFMHA
jgi:hypothetical protein